MTPLMRQGAAVVLFFFSVIAILPTQAPAQETSEARKILVKTPATYPTLARSMNIHGVVKVEVQVMPNGTVKAVDVKGGHPLLTQSTVTAVGHWKFEPAAHETRELIEIKFDPE